MDVLTETFTGGSPFPEGVEGKKFSIRAAAYIIDFVSIYALTTAAGYVFGIIFFALLTVVLIMVGGDYYLEDSESRFVSLVIGVIYNILYFTLFEWLCSSSLGKLVLRMCVVNQDGDLCDIRQAATRAVYRLIDGLVFGLVAYQSMKAPLYQRNGDKEQAPL